MEWFRHEQERVYGLLGFTNAGPNDAKLLELIRKHAGKLSPNELRRYSARYKGDPEGAEMALQALVDANKGSWVSHHKGRIFELSTIYESTNTP